MSAAGKRPWLSVVFPARNEGDRVKAAIDSIVAGRSEAFPLQIVVVDDASADGCCNGIGRLYSPTRDGVRIDVIRLPRWSGIPHARNAGAAAARGEHIFVTDANVGFPPGWDLPIRRHAKPGRALSATIAGEAEFRGYGCTLLLPSMTACWLPGTQRFGGFVPVAPCTGSVIPAALFRQLGGYDTSMPMYGAAEPEFSVRLWLSGGEIVCLPDLVLTHRFRPKPEREQFLKAIRRIQVQNFLRFGLLYLDEVRMNEVNRHYANRFPDIFDECSNAVWQSDVAVRREALRKSLPGNFSFFVERFGLR